MFKTLDAEFAAILGDDSAIRLAQQLAEKVKAFLDADDMEGLRRFAEEELAKLDNPEN